MANDNLLLARLPAELLQRLKPRLEPVQLDSGLCLAEVGASIRYAYFPTRGLIAIELATADGHALELAAVGREGIIGVPLVLGDETSPYRVVVRSKTTALRIKASALAAEMPSSVLLQRAVLESSRHVLRQISHAGLCFRAHTVLQRLCRWLLAAADHLESDTVHVTHDSLMQALGVARSAVSKAMIELQEGDAIWHRHGCVMVRNRSRLEATVCECYLTLRPHDLVSPSLRVSSTHRFSPHS